jgi:hypothetical protein
MINYYSKEEYLNYLNWKRNDEGDKNSKYYKEKMSKEKFVKLGEMDEEEIIFYDTLFNKINQFKFNEEKKVLIEPLFKSNILNEEMIKENDNNKKLEKKKSNGLNNLNTFDQEENKKNEMIKYNDEIIRKFGNN